MAPIDPAQLLKALAPLLSTDGGINGLEKAAQFASLMKKFSKKLVSRCVYCNVLKATDPEILSSFLSEGGWNTINNWLNDAKDNNNGHFLIELLQLCLNLPMTIERLKENTTPKIVKTLMKYENKDVKSLSEELVTKWMVLIKGDSVVEVMKKKRKLSKDLDKEQKDPKKIVKKTLISPIKGKKPVKNGEKEKFEQELSQRTKETNSLKNQKNSAKTLKDKLRNVSAKNAKLDAQKNFPDKTVNELPSRSPVGKLRGTKRTSGDYKNEIYEDVKIKIDPEPVPKKPKVDRPKTVKSPHTKFRATGLEEEIPLPKKITKKSAIVEKSATSAILAKTAATKKLNSCPDKVTEKKIKPETLLNVTESTNQNGGIKLIPAKPQPTHVLHESASFMDALTAQPAPLPKRKKKTPTSKPTTPTTPPSPTIKPPKLQFYKDTLEMNSEESSNKDASKSEEEEKDTPGSPKKEESAEVSEKADKGDIDESEKSEEVETSKSENCDTPASPTSSDSAVAADANEKPEGEVKAEKESSPKEKEEETEIKEQNSNQMKSILAHGKQRGRRKSVHWVEDDKLKEVFYFEMDETERENVMKHHRPFGDMKTLEAKREREFFENVKRQAGDKMEEAIPWWTVPILIDVPPPLVVYGVYSQEKEIQRLRHQSTLQEIYFSRDMVPDTPHEPEIEIVPVQEPKIIPLDEENVIGTVMDYSGQDIPKPKPVLPEVLSSLIKISNSRPQPFPTPVSQAPMDMGGFHAQSSMSPVSPYDPGEPVGPGMLPPMNPQLNPPPMFQQPQIMEPDKMIGMGMPNFMMPMEPGMLPPIPPESFFGNFPMGPQMMMEPLQQQPLLPPSQIMPLGNVNQRMMGNERFRQNMNEGGHFPNDGPRFSNDSPRFPNDGPQFSNDAPRFPTDGPRFPNDAPRFPNDGPRFPNDAPRFPNDGPQFPNDGPRFPNESGRFPNKSGRFPNESGRFPNESGRFQNDGPRFPNDGPRFPRPGGPRGGGPRGGPRVIPCRHFLVGSCRFGNSCTFLHPGVNGPPL